MVVVPLVGKLAVTGHAHGVVAVLQQHSLRRRSRSGRPAAPAGPPSSNPRPPVPAPRAATPPAFAAARGPRAWCRWTRARSARRLAAPVPEAGDHDHAVDQLRHRPARRQGVRCPPRRGSSRPPRRAPASCATGGPRTRAPPPSARRCRRRAARGVRHARRRRARPPPRSGCRGLARPAADHVHQLLAVALEGVALLDRESALLELAPHESASGPVARRAGAAVRPPRRESCAWSSAAWSPSNTTSAARPCGSGRGRLSSENIASDDRQQSGHERRSVDPGLDHRPPATYNLGQAPLRLADSMAPQAPRILLVDDEQSVQKLLAYPLRKEGYEVVAALDGQEALDRLRETTFDLVVLDLMLPKVDGFEVCRQVRARSSVPIIMLTAKAEEIDKVLGLELGADDYITKPFSMREFRSRVKAVLRRAAAGAGRGPGEEPLEDGDLRIDFEKRQVHLRRRAGPAHLRGVRDPRRARAPPRARVQPRWSCSSASGATPPTATRARSTCTSATCARSSRATQATRADPHRARRRVPLQGPMSVHWPRAAFAAQQARAGLLRDHRRGLLGPLLLRRPAARVEPAGAQARRPARSWPPTRARR